MTGMTMPSVAQQILAQTLDEALALEARGLEWRVWHVAAFLDIGRSTVYQTPWLMAIAKQSGRRGLRWVPAEVRNRGPIAAPRPTKATRARRRAS